MDPVRTDFGLLADVALPDHNLPKELQIACVCVCVSVDCQYRPEFLAEFSDLHIWKYDNSPKYCIS